MLTNTLLHQRYGHTRTSRRSRASLAVVQAAEAAADGRPAPTSDLDQARVIPGQRTHFYADCPPAPQSPLIPADATCVTVIATDLDGDGTTDDKLDRVIMYQQNVQTYDGQLTIAGYSTARHPDALHPPDLPAVHSRRRGRRLG